MAPTVVLVFFLLVWNVCPEGPAHSPAVGQGAKPLGAPKNMHPTVPKTGSKTDQKYLDCCAFFYVHCSTKSQENSKWFKILNSQVPYQKQNVYVYIFSWTIFHKF